MEGISAITWPKESSEERKLEVRQKTKEVLQTLSKQELIYYVANYPFPDIVKQEYFAALNEIE